MKKLGVLAAVSLLVLFLCAPVQAQPATGGPWVIPSAELGDLVPGDWQELLYGGGEGQPGNEIQAASETLAVPTLYTFLGGLLDNVEVLEGPNPPQLAVYGTTYKGAQLILFNVPDAPWYNCAAAEGASFVFNIDEAYVTTTKYEDDQMDFILDAVGISADDPNYAVVISAVFGKGSVGYDPPVVDPESPARIFGTLTSVSITITGPTILAVDVKPCSCPNPLNLRSKGVLPVAILGSADLDVMNIDPESITLNGVAQLRYNYEDVAAPKEGCEPCITCGPDGYMDMTVKFSRQAIIATLPEGLVHGDTATLILTALLDGTLVQGEDQVVIKGKPKMKQVKVKQGKMNQNKNKNKNK